jgi:hypothetical protein
MSELTQPVVQEQLPAEEARAAIIEIVEQHQGADRHPYVGAGSVIIPNHLRINGTALWATVDNPAVVNEIVIDGQCRSPFKVTVQLNARALKIGGTPAFDADADGGAGKTSGAMVEIPDLDVLEPGAEVERPYVLLNGHRLYIEGSVGIGALATDGAGNTVARVTLTLACRKLIVDDELLAPVEPAKG